MSDWPPRVGDDVMMLLVPKPRHGVVVDDITRTGRGLYKVRVRLRDGSLSDNEPVVMTIDELAPIDAVDRLARIVTDGNG